jgi:hypothetical protein
MRKIPYRRPVRHDVFELPLFHGLQCAGRRSTTGGRWLHRHRAIPRELADLVAELACIGEQDRPMTRPVSLTVRARIGDDHGPMVTVRARSRVTRVEDRGVAA